MRKYIYLGALELAPYQYLNNKNKVEGLNIELLSKSFELVNYDIRINLYKNMKQMFSDYNDLKIEAVVTSAKEKKLFNSNFKELKLSKNLLEKSGNTRLNNKYKIFFRDNDKEILENFNKGLKIMIDTNQYFEILKKWKLNSRYEMGLK